MNRTSDYKRLDVHYGIIRRDELHGDRVDIIPINLKSGEYVIYHSEFILKQRGYANPLNTNHNHYLITNYGTMCKYDSLCRNPCGHTYTSPTRYFNDVERKEVTVFCTDGCQSYSNYGPMNDIAFSNAQIDTVVNHLQQYEKTRYQIRIYTPEWQDGVSSNAGNYQMKQDMNNFESTYAEIIAVVSAKSYLHPMETIIAESCKDSDIQNEWKKIKLVKAKLVLEKKLLDKQRAEFELERDQWNADVKATLGAFDNMAYDTSYDRD
jgi:hypothetical protein